MARYIDADKIYYSNEYGLGLVALKQDVDDLPTADVVERENIKLLGEEHRKFREGITDEKVLIGYNMAIAICNKYLGESGDKGMNEEELRRALYDKGRADVLDKIRAEIVKNKTEHEIRITEKDIETKWLINDIYCDIFNILNKYNAKSGDKE